MDFHHLSHPTGVCCLAPTENLPGQKTCHWTGAGEKTGLCGVCHFTKSRVELIVCVGNADPLGKTPQGKGLSFCIFIPELELAGSSLEGCLGENVPWCESTWQTGVTQACSAACPGSNFLLDCALIGQVTTFHTGTGTSAFLIRGTIQRKRGFELSFNYRLGKGHSAVWEKTESSREQPEWMAGCVNTVPASCERQWLLRATLQRHSVRYSGGRTGNQMPSYCTWQLSIEVKGEWGVEYRKHVVLNVSERYKGQKYLDEIQIA